MNPTLFRALVLPVVDRSRGLHTGAAYRNLMQTQHWDRERLNRLQSGRLADLLEHAYVSVPFYRRAFKDRGLRPSDIASPADLGKLPALTKEDIRRNPRDLRSTTTIKPVFPNHTGGSTGEPLHFWFDGREKSMAAGALMRAFAWAGAEPGDRVCVLAGGSLDGRESRRRALFQRIAGRLELPAFELSKDTVTRFADRIRSHRPRLLHGYASTLYQFALLCRDAGIDDLRFEAAMTTAELLNPLYRTTIESRFGCRVFDLYGCSEINGIAAQCQIRDGYHVTDEKVILESIPAESGEGTELLVTNLTNFTMPFIRYRVGDAVDSVSEPCGCGRALSRLGAVRGRVFAFIRTAQGELLAGELFPHLFRDYRSFDYFQIVQDRVDEVRVILVKSNDFHEAELGKLRSQLQTVLGEGMQITLTFVDEIPRSRSGKLRVTVSNLDPLGGAKL